MSKRFDGYAEAAKIDSSLGDLLTRFPVEQHQEAWAALTRTVGTTLDLVIPPTYRIPVTELRKRIAELEQRVGDAEALLRDAFSLLVVVQRFDNPESAIDSHRLRQSISTLLAQAPEPASEKVGRKLSIEEVERLMDHAAGHAVILNANGSFTINMASADIDTALAQAPEPASEEEESIYTPDSDSRGRGAARVAKPNPGSWFAGDRNSQAPPGSGMARWKGEK